MYAHERVIHIRSSSDIKFQLDYLTVSPDLFDCNHEFIDTIAAAGIKYYGWLVKMYRKENIPF